MPDKNRDHLLLLSSLAQGMPGLTPSSGGVMAEAASVCLEEQGHEPLTTLTVEGDFSARVSLLSLQVDERMRSSHSNADKATENGAYGISILAVRHLTRLVVLRQSAKWTGIDYWLGPEGGDFFQDATRLEVSGIRRGTEHSIRARLRQKIRQVRKWQFRRSPMLVSVVEFSRPVMRISKG